MGAPAVRTPARRPRTGPRPAAKPRPAGAASARQPAKPRSAATRTAPARRRKRHSARAGSGGSVVLFPVAAVGRTATAVGDLADCGLVTSMARSRLWIGVLGVLLGGIVAVNVYGLSLSASTSATASKIDALERDNSIQRARIASRTSGDKIEAKAAALGFALPAPDEIRYLYANDDDAAKAAKRLADGLVAAAAPVVADTSTSMPADPAAVEPAAVDPATGAPIDPAAAAPDPTAVAPATTDPTAATTPVP